MSLPKFHPRRETVRIEGELVEIRSLTRDESARCQKLVDANPPDVVREIEIAVIGYGTDTPTDEVRAWYEQTDSHAAAELFDAIKALSRIDEGASKSSGAGDSPG